MSNQQNEVKRLTKVIYNRLRTKRVKIENAYEVIEQMIVNIDENGRLNAEQITGIIDHLVGSGESGETENKDSLQLPASEYIEQTSSEPTYTPTYTPMNEESALTIGQAKGIVMGVAEELDLNISISDLKVIANNLQTNFQEVNDYNHLASQLLLEYVQHTEDEHINQTSALVNSVMGEFNASLRRREQHTKQTFTHLNEEVEKSTKFFRGSYEQFKAELPKAFPNSKLFKN